MSSPSQARFDDGRVIASAVSTEAGRAEEELDAEYTAEPLEIGKLDDGYHFQGAIDSVAIYARALHLAEVANHWAHGAGEDICTR